MSSGNNWRMYNFGISMLNGVLGSKGRLMALPVSFLQGAASSGVPFVGNANKTWW
jgi:hypothetical protein